jgi:hypothetical protein
MMNISITLYRNKFFGAVLKSPIQRGSLSVNNSVTNISWLGTFKLTIPDFLTTVFLYLVVTLALKKNPSYSIGLEIRPQSAFTAFRVLLPSANYGAEWSVGVWQPSADSNGHLAHYHCRSRAATPGPESSNKKGAKLPLPSAEGFHTQLEGQHCPLITAYFSRVEKPSDEISSRLVWNNFFLLGLQFCFFQKFAQKSLS